MNNLTKVFKTGFSPEDPFSIFKRMKKIFVYNNVGPYDEENYLPVVMSEDMYFFKWIYQEIPVGFWKFNSYISANIDRIRTMAKSCPRNTIWINMDSDLVKQSSRKNKETNRNKLKCVEYHTVLNGIKDGVFYLPDYNEIADEVNKWGYKYEYGKISTQWLKFK